MNNKLLSAAILCVLAKSALGFEVESNNDSSKANPLGTENVGQLSSGGDVDFFSITNSCIKYTADDAKSDTTGKIKAGDCAKYTVDDLNAIPPQKTGEIKYRSEISLAFSCDSRAAAAKSGWYLGLLDSAGILQNTYHVQSSDCMVGASGSQGPYSFKFSTLSGDNKLIPNAKYYLSVVGDCHVPIYSIPQSLNPVVGVNTFVQSTTAKQADIDAAKAEISKARPFLDTAIKALNDANFSTIGSNASIAQASDALSNATDIVNKAGKDLETGITTAVTTINAVSSTAKAVKIMSDAMNFSVQMHTIFLEADAAIQNPAIQIAIDAADVEVDIAANTLASLSTTATAAEKSAANNAKALADAKKKAAQTAQTNLKTVQKNAKTADDDATKKLGEANTALIDSVNVLNAVVKTDIAAANAATDSGSRTNSACAESNTATYTIKDNQDNSPKITPYLDIAAKNPPALGLQSSGQTGSAYDVDFYTVTGNALAEIPLDFSCLKNSAKGSTEGWVVSAWTKEKDKPEFAYQISPKDCEAANPYPLKLPKYSGNYYIGIQSACALAPTDTSSLLQLIYYSESGNPTDSAQNYLCNINTASFTIKQGEIANVLDLTNLNRTNQLISSQKGSVKTAVDSNLYYLDSTNPRNDVALIFSCPNANPFTNNWKLSIYNEAKTLLTSQLINGSSCREDSETGLYKVILPSGSSRYYLSIGSTCTDADDKICQLDKSEYTISRDVAVKQTKLDTNLLKTAIELGTDKTGQINSTTDNDVYIVESNNLPEIPLVFSCTPMAVRKTNDWQLNIYDDSNELVSSQVINGSDCGSGFKADKGGYKFKVISNDSTRYYLSVKSTCTTTDCVVDTSDYNIARDVTKTYTGILATAKTITTKKANFKLTNCGSNANATIAVNAENVNLSKKLNPINIQIGGMTCQTTTPIVANSLLGTIVNPSTISDSTLIAKDNVTTTLSDCGAAKGKITLTGTGLNLENLNPENVSDSVSIPVKVDFGDFHCAGKDIFYIQGNDTGDISYSNSIPKVIDSTPTIPTVITPPIDITPPVVVDPIVTALSVAQNIGVSQKNKLKSVKDVQAYYVDTGSNLSGNFEFNCPDSIRFANDWTLSTYDNTKKLINTKIINGSECGSGKFGDSGTFSFSSMQNSTRTYFVIQSACENTDKACVVDSSQYEIKRIIPAKVPTSETPTTIKTCSLISGCGTISTNKIK